MCVLALAWHADPKWRIVVAANRDELHARPSLPLERRDGANGMIAGRDAAGGGTWLGISSAGRFAGVTNLHGFGLADPTKVSRGALVTDIILGGDIDAFDLYAFNPFNLFAITLEQATHWTNRPIPQRTTLSPGVHVISNGAADEIWPKARRLKGAIAAWIAAQSAEIEPLFQALRDERPPPGCKSCPDQGEPICSPVFIRHPIYGTRCSTVVTIDADGNGWIAERRFDAAGTEVGETRLSVRWPS